jgi:hypothetical protein
MIPVRIPVITLLAAVLAACAPLAPVVDTPVSPAAAPDPVAALKLDRAVEDRLLALDPENVTEQDVRETLSKVPAPRIVLLHGGVYPVHVVMRSFARFLIGMGYPAEQIRHPGDGSWSHSPYERSERIAGMIAWAYERDGLRPMIVGHSQGGIQAVKVLHDLAGTFDTALPVWNPMTDSAERRTFIIDPYTRTPRPVVGVQVSFASVVGAGGPSVLLPNNWAMMRRLRTIPDTAVQFNGYFLGIDWFAMSLADVDADGFSSPSGKVQVRNVILPAGYLHVTVPVTHYLLDKPDLKRMVDEYRATTERPDEATMPGTYSDNFYYAADNWASIKKHWVLEARRLVLAKRAGP